MSLADKNKTGTTSTLIWSKEELRNDAKTVSIHVFCCPATTLSRQIDSGCGPQCAFCADDAVLEGGHLATPSCGGAANLEGT